MRAKHIAELPASVRSKHWAKYLVEKPAHVKHRKISEKRADKLIGHIYNIGGNTEKTNIEVVELICKLLDSTHPRKDKVSYLKQISFVKDRQGHDRRYAIDSSKIQKELGWKPKETLVSGMKKTVKWYLDNDEWVKNVVSGDYKKWIDKHYS